MSYRHSRFFSERARTAQSCARIAGIVLGATLIHSSLVRAQTSQPVPPDPYGFVLDHVTAVVADLDKATEWYSRVLGLQKSGCIARGTDFRACQMLAPGVQIDLVEQKGSNRNKRGSFADQGWLHVVVRTSQIARFYDSLKSQHVAIEGSPDPKGSLRRFVIHDLEGNEIEVVGT